MSANVYLAGPIQHAADHGKGWRQRLKDGEIEYEGSIKWTDPLDKYNTHEMEHQEWTSEQIVEDDLEMIANSDAILVHWIEVPTCGTPMEVFFSQWFPQIGEAMISLAAEVAEKNDTSNTVELFDAGEEAGLPVWMLDTIIAAGIKEDIPVVVQTRVPPEEISPWLTSHSDAIVETFSEGAHWIENNVNAGDAPEAETLEPEYEIV